MPVNEAFRWTMRRFTLLMKIQSNGSTSSAISIAYVRIKKLSYHRAMRPIYGCPENFGNPWLPSRLYLSYCFHRLLFPSTLWICIQNLKFVALPIPEIIGVAKKFGQFLAMPTLPIAKKSYRPYIQTVYTDCSSMCTRLPEIFDWSFFG